MNALKAAAPFALGALVCLPCLAIGLAATGGVLAAVGGAVLTPAVGGPLLVVGVTLVASGGWWLKRRQACERPGPPAASETRR